MRIVRIPRLGPLLVASALLLAACASLGATDQAKVTLYQQNAAQYYGQGHYERAYQQWSQVLAIDAEDDKSRLGQAMCLAEMGRRETPEAVQYLAQADERLEDLRHESLSGLQYRAVLGYALVQERWVQLYDRKVAQLESEKERRGATDEEELRTARGELSKRIGIAESHFRQVLEGPEQEAQYQLTCMLGMSRMAMMRGDLEESLVHAREYAQQVDKSKRLWRDAIDRYPSEAPLYERRLAGAERQEAELRDLMANVLFKLDRLDEAEAELNIVLDIAPTREGAYLNRGIVREARQDWDRAREDLQTFLDITELGPDDPSVIEATRRLADVEQRLQEEDAALRSEAGG